MTDQNRVQTFSKVLERLESSDVPSQKDLQVIQRLNITQPNRIEHETPAEADRPANVNAFLKSHDAPRFQDVQTGLRQVGWEAMPVRSHLGAGGYGQVILAFLREDTRDIESKQLCAAKIQKLWSKEHPTSKFDSIWREISCLKACVHPNIIGYYGHFYVLPRNEHGSMMREKAEAVILMEYASAGNLPKELDRAGGCLAEACARYYMLQITAGLKHLHNRWIAHMDLHEYNILFKYNRDSSKTCMIADFGVSDFLPPERRTEPPSYPDNFFTRDIIQVIDLLHLMLVGMEHKHEDASCVNASDLALQLIDARDDCKIRSVDALLKLPWFKSTDIEPFVLKKRTPLFSRRSAIPPELRVSPVKTPSPQTHSPTFVTPVPTRGMPQQHFDAAARRAVDQELEETRTRSGSNLRTRIGRSLSRMRVAVRDRFGQVNCFRRRNSSGRDSGIGKSHEQLSPRCSSSHEAEK